MTRTQLATPPNADPGLSPAGANWAAALPVLAGALVALAVALRLVAVLPEVPNRNAMTYDAARRAMLDVDAADALRKGRLAALLGYVAGPEAWPTLRVVAAAPVHALAGPARALAVEHGVSLALTSLLFLVLGVTAWSLVREPFQALLVFGIAAPLLLGSRDLLEHAVNGMLEVPSALFTLAATAAWTVSRQTQTTRPWGVALLGNLLFHVKFQHGLLFAAAVLLIEGGAGSGRQVLRTVFSVIFRPARRWLSFTILGFGLAGTLLGFWLVARGGVEGTIFGQHLSLRLSRGPQWFGALALFAFVEVGIWGGREQLRADVPARARYLWTWLLTPMVAWILVPLTWRLQTLGASLTFDSGTTRPEVPLDALLFFPRAAWEGWFPPGARWVALVLLCVTGAAAWRSALTRRILLPLGAVAAVELAVLTLFNHRNYQPRLIVNLAPLVALAAAAWVPAVARPLPRLLLGSWAATLAACMVLPVWSRPTLVATLSRGFESRQNGDGCREVARSLPLKRGVVVNETAPSRLQACNMWVKFFARERDAEVVVRAPWTGAGPHEVLVLADGSESLGPRPGLDVDSEEVQVGPIKGRRYRTAGP